MNNICEITVFANKNNPKLDKRISVTLVLPPWSKTNLLKGPVLKSFGFYRMCLKSQNLQRETKKNMSFFSSVP